jgi:hypothetical protein
MIRSGAGGRLDGTSPDEVDAIAAELASARHVVLHFHGGLVDEAAGHVIAASLDPVYRQAGATPLFFVWRSGLRETLQGSLGEILREDVFTRMLRWVLRYAAGRARDLGGDRDPFGAPAVPLAEVEAELAGRDAGHEPFAGRVPAGAEPLSERESAAFQQRMSQDAMLREEVRALAGAEEVAAGVRGAGAPVGERRTTLMDPEVLAELTPGGEDGSRALISTTALVRRCAIVLWRVVERFRDGTDHGIYPTVVEELLRAFYLAHAGAALWNAMKEATRLTFEPGPAPGERAGRLLLDRLGDRLAGARTVPEIVLVGHSAGSVFINNLLGAPAARLPIAKVALLAPACTTSGFATVLRDRPDALRCFRMFTMTEQAECADRLVGAFYPLSLLYLVSAVLERGDSGASVCTPLLGLARFLTPGRGGAADVDSVRGFVTAPGADRLVLSPGDGGPGLRAGAVSHGAFDDDSAVRASLQHFIGGDR